MKPIRRTTLCLTALTLAFSLTTLAAEPAVPAKKRVSPVRVAKRPADVAPQPVGVPYNDQPGQAVYQVLIAEIALQRGDIELASKAYADLALRTRDPKVLERTIEVAEYARRFDLALDMARLWLDIEPASKRAQQLMASALILANKLDDLAPNLIRLLEVDKESLGDNLLGLNRMFAQNKDHQAVFRLIDQVCLPFFGAPEAHYAVSMAASSAGDYDRALAEARRALELRPDWEMAALLEAQLLSRVSPADAISFLQGFVEHNPKAQDSKLNLARALIGEKRYVEARRYFDQLLKDHPDSAEIVYASAILALQQNDSAFAEAQFKHLLTLNVPDKSLAYYYLGQIVEEGKRGDEALAYYARVEAGEQYLPAQMRSAHILADQGKLDVARQHLGEATTRTPEERMQLVIAEAGLLREAKQTNAAFDLLERALASQPEQPDLLYETALLAEKIGRIDLLERNLRKLIVLRPESAQAYNALGYSYADRSIHLPEAQELIQKALQLTPDDPFILDSMGWVLYRQGDLPGALTYLERAYAKRDDPEVAVHLGEVLWVLGRKEDAQRTLHDSQQKYPGNEAVSDALKKFVP